MNNMKKTCIFLLVCYMMGLVGPIMPKAEAAEELRAMVKADDYPPDDTIKTWVAPNVLFLLDISGPMTFTPTGRMPIYNDGESSNTHADWFKHSTFGSGFRPLSFANSSGIITEPRGTTTGTTYQRYAIFTNTERNSASTGTRKNPSYGYGRYGRDLDGSNNIIGDPDCYYTSDPSKPYLLTFRSRTLADWDGKSTLDKSAVLNETKLTGGHLDFYYKSINPSDKPINPPTLGTLSASSLPNILERDLDELLTYMPGPDGTTKGPVPEHLWGFLVPNDSRMYKMKLVLWRLLEENGKLLSKMKLGMASTLFTSNYHNTNRTVSVLHKSYPYDAATLSSGGQSVQFWNGVGPWYTDNILNNNRSYLANTSGRTVTGIDVTYYDGALTSQSWMTVNRARMLVPFDYMYNAEDDGSYTRADNLPRFQQYIDGIEAVYSSANIAPRNPEFMPSGKVPLSTSIYGHAIPGGGSILSRKDLSDGPALRYAGQFLPSSTSDAINAARNSTTYSINYDGSTYGTSTNHVLMNNYLLSEANPDGSGTTEIIGGTAVGSVIDFFSPPKTGNSVLEFNATKTAGYFPVVGSCQRNWLVVFTAGNDSKDGMAPADAVKALYEKTSTMRGRKWDSNSKKWVETTHEMESGVRTLVVGFVHPTANDDQSVKLRQTLSDMAIAGDPGNSNAAPFFANDVPSLIASLKAVLLRINADKYASTSPAATPETTADGDELLLYVPSYIATYYDQWEGYFDKYRISEEGVSSHDWEVNDKLEANTSRSLYAYPSPAGSTSTAIVPLDSTPASAFGISSNETEFKQWLRAFNEESFLGDMEHSGYAIVGSTNVFSGRERTVYLQTNRGFLHAINDNGGSEKWAFMPPNAVPRVKAMKYDSDGNWISATSSPGARLDSNPLNLLDGPMIQKDVKPSATGSYKTILLNNLGWGGAGLYAMDVTSSGSPNFLWAVDNARYASFDVDSVKLWGRAAAQVGSEDYGYTDLGFTIAPAAMVRIKGSEERDVALLPGGLGYMLGKDDDKQGKIIYVLNPETGAIEQRLSEENSSFVTPLSSRRMGMMLAPVTFVENSSKITTEFYTGDSNGNLLRCQTENKEPKNWKLENIFQVVSSGNNPLVISKALAVADAPRAGGRWLFAATADVMVPDPTTDTRRIENPEQYVVGVIKDRVASSDNSLSLEDMAYETDDIDGGYGVTKGTGALGASVTGTPTYKGWRLKLRPAVGNLKAEYVTTAPYIYGGYLFFSTFTPRDTAGDNAAVCPKLGDSKLYAFNPLNGAGLWGDNGSQAITFKDAKISGVTAVNGKLYVGLKAFSAYDTSKISEEARDQSRVIDQQLVEISLPVSSKTEIPSKVPFVHYWKEGFGDNQ